MKKRFIALILSGLLLLMNAFPVLAHAGQTTTFKAKYVITKGSKVKFQYKMSKAGSFTIELYNPQGKLIKQLAKGKVKKAGTYTYIWQGTSPGNYILRAYYIYGKKKVLLSSLNVTVNDINLKVSAYHAVYEAGKGVHIGFVINKKATVSISVYDHDNKLIATLLNKKSFNPGEVMTYWDLKDYSMAPQMVMDIMPGTYHVKIEIVEDNGRKTVLMQPFTVTEEMLKMTEMITDYHANYESGKGVHIGFMLHKKATVTVNVYDHNNNFVAGLIQQKVFEPGDVMTYWDLKDYSMAPAMIMDIQPGTYHIKIEAVDEMGMKTTFEQPFTVTAEMLTVK
ncbi:modifier protein of major autolysin LytC [Carboxydothermus islandicus]|uniref:Modifier protein of major autolysin LytC n=1 Tax=Carboxydothermus islandicus TaxID=661089 RepID=A0A1L8D1X1_9THEO|nr:hypothetical protein [Carboxydothermus islandicus]GAV25186.1 modifier protein of major autolysin LytC [Carboxydothermus islandicus]